KGDRVWSEREAAAIADAVRGQAAVVTEESKPTTQASPLLFDLTSLQREANGRFGFSAKGTLSIAQSLYERHKALTYPRTDSRALPEDYLPVARETFQMLAKSGMPHLEAHARTAIENGYIKPSRRIFENTEGPQSLVPVTPGETVAAETVTAKALKTRPPARYSEATLLGAMEGAGKLVEDDELRDAMQEKGLGTPATRASIIEGLLNEKYMLREGREMIPTAKAFQLMTLLRGLGVEELSKAELTGEWEYKLAQMEHGKLSRDAFMREIAEMTKRIVMKAKEYDRDTVP